MALNHGDLIAAAFAKALPASRCVPIAIGRIMAMAPSQIEIRLRGERAAVVAAEIDGATLSRLVGAIERAVGR